MQKPKKNLYGYDFQTQLNTNVKEESLSLQGKLILWATCFSNSKHKCRISLKNDLKHFF